MIIIVIALGLILFWSRNWLRRCGHRMKEGMKRSFRYEHTIRLRRLRGWKPSGTFEILEVFCRIFVFSLMTVAVSYLVLGSLTELVFKLIRGGR